MLNNVIVEVQVSEEEIDRLAKLLNKGDSSVPCCVWLRVDEDVVTLIRSSDKLAVEVSLPNTVTALLETAIKHRIGIVEVTINVEGRVLSISMLQDTVPNPNVSYHTNALIVQHDLRLQGLMYRFDGDLDLDADEFECGWDFEVKLS